MGFFTLPLLKRALGRIQIWTTQRRNYSLSQCLWVPFLIGRIIYQKGFPPSTDQPHRKTEKLSIFRSLLMQSQIQKADFIPPYQWNVLVSRYWWRGLSSKDICNNYQTDGPMHMLLNICDNPWFGPGKWLSQMSNDFIFLLDGLASRVIKKGYFRLGNWWMELERKWYLDT